MAIPLTKALVHDPEEKLDYSFDWSDALVTGETIADSSWTVAAGTVSIATTYNGSASTTADGTINGGTTTVWVVAAQLGDVRLTNHITTSTGREYERTALLSVQHQ